MVARSVLQPTATSIPVRFFNLTPEAVRIFAGKRIGTLERVENISETAAINKVDSTQDSTAVVSEKNANLLSWSKRSDQNSARSKGNQLLVNYADILALEILDEQGNCDTLSILEMQSPSNSRFDAYLHSSRRR